MDFKKSIFQVLTVFFLVTTPVYASVQNVKISGDIETTFLHRKQLDLGSQVSAEQQQQDVFFTQTRLRVDSDLTDNVSATVALINERAWNEDREDNVSASANGGVNDVDINLAYVTLREMLYSPLTVIIGRQQFAYGYSFVIDSQGVNNAVSSGGLRGVAEDFSKRRAMDAVRLVLDYNPLTIDVVGAKVDENTVGGLVPHNDDVNLLGTNMNYKLGDAWDTILEGYFWAKIDNSVKVNGFGLGPGLKADTVYMPGGRVQISPIKDVLIFSTELAVQRGNKATTFIGLDNVEREAFAGQFITVWFVPFEPLKKMHTYIIGAYTYLSGDSGPAQSGADTADDAYTAWDPMYENQADGLYNAMSPSSTDSHSGYLKVTSYFSKELHTELSWLGIWLDQAIDDGTGSCGPAATCGSLLFGDGNSFNPRMTNNIHYGDEVGIRLVYDYTEDVQFKTGGAWFIPGNAFHSDNSRIATQFAASTLVKF